MKGGSGTLPPRMAQQLLQGGMPPGALARAASGDMPAASVERHRQMWEANERSAAYYFRCLNAAAPHAAQRKELLEAGVSERRVLRLYPVEFTDIAPGIQRHLERLPEGWFHEGSDADWFAQPQRLIQNQTMRHATQEQRAQLVAAHQANVLARSIDERLEQLQSALVKLADRAEIGQFRGFRIFETLFHAWWLMSHRSEFSANAKRTIDEAMIWVAEHILFDIHLMFEDLSAGT